MLKHSAAKCEKSTFHSHPPRPHFRPSLGMPLRLVVCISYVHTALTASDHAITSVLALASPFPIESVTNLSVRALVGDNKWGQLGREDNSTRIGDDPDEVHQQAAEEEEGRLCH